MRFVITISAAFFFVGWLPGCGSEIGDSCSLDVDCSPEGDRICAIGPDLPGGYCTVFGCDHGTCPDGSVCVRFFAVAGTSVTCDPATEDNRAAGDMSTDACTPDELCTVGGSCVPRTAEVRYCMKTCEGDGDCRDQYHCRDDDRMKQYGGEPVPPPGERLGDDIQPFCATAPR